MDEAMRLFEGVIGVIRDVFRGLSDVLGLGLTDYDIGFLTGLPVLMLIGFLAFQLFIWWNNIVTAFRPQRVMHMTAKSPAQAFGSSMGALLKFAGVIVIVLAVLLLLSGLVYVEDGALGFIAGILLLIVGFILS